jgi:RNA polymerase sigma factor (sigma-70 family)
VADTPDTWFQREILPHEAALLRYLRRTWRQQDEIHDLRQEIYARVYEAAARSRPHSAKSFLFTTARNLLADRVRRGRIVSIEAVGSPDSLNVLVDELSPERRLTSWQELRRVMQALNRLPPRCREVVWLRKVDELSTQEVATQMGVGVRTVEGQILKGMRMLTDTLLGRGSALEPDDGAEDIDVESGHGK